MEAKLQRQVTEYPTEYLFRLEDLRISYSYGIDRSYRPMHNYTENLFAYVSGSLLEPAIKGADAVQACLIANYENWRDSEPREGNDAPTAFGSIDLQGHRLEVLAGVPYPGIKLLVDLWLGGASTFITLTGDRLKRRKARFHHLWINTKRPNYE